MKNSPHHRKHLKHKAIRQARQIDLNTTLPTSPKNIRLNPLNVSRCKEVLNIYKKHLEREHLLHKKGHHSRRTTPKEIERLGHDTMNLRNRHITYKKAA